MTDPTHPCARAQRLSVAPMMDWTDRHCRAFHRVLSDRALLYTEMVTAPAVIHGDRDRLVGRAADDRTALQLGGSDAEQVAQAAAIGADRGYREVNLNCGCPSDRVQSGAFGAVLMERPADVAGIAAAMIAAVPGDCEITVKCRIGVDDQDPRAALPAFLTAIEAAGVRRVTVHARKAWLQGLSPKQNRDVPPLDYALVADMVAAFPGLSITLNGGIDTLDAARTALALGVDGAMIGRAAYHMPHDILAGVDAAVFGGAPGPSPEAAARAMLPHIEAHLSAGGRLHQVTRHMLGLFHGRPGARGWRRVLSERGPRDGAGTEVVLAALAQVEGAVAA